MYLLDVKQKVDRHMVERKGQRSKDIRSKGKKVDSVQKGNGLFFKLIHSCSVSSIILAVFFQFSKYEQFYEKKNLLEHISKYRKPG